MKKLTVVVKDIAAVFNRYYGLLLVALVATAAFIGNSYMEHESDFLTKLGLVCLMGISLMFALHMAQQRHRFRWLLPVGGFMVLALYILLLPPVDTYRYQPATVIVLAVSSICFHLLVAFIPFWKRGDTDGFWDYNKNVFINLVQTVVFTLVLWGGLALAIVAVEKLFGFNMVSHFWERLAYTILILGSSFIFALFAKDGLGVLKITAPYPPVLRFFVQYVLVPLLIIYVLILYSYGVKIMAEWDLPKGWVSYLVLAYSFLGMLSLLLLDPLYEAADKIWVRFFSRSFYITLLPLLVLLFVAIGVRIADYGVTENRYFVLVLAFWLLAMTVYRLLRQQNAIKVIPMSLFVAGVCSLVLPFANVFSVSFNSQHNRFHRLLSEQEVLTPQGKIDFGHRVNRSALNEIGSVFHYLHTRRQYETIRALTPDDKAAKVDSLLAARLANEFDFTSLFTQVVEDDAANRSVSYTTLATVPGGYDRVFETQGYDFLLPMVYMGPGYAVREYALGNDSFVLQIGEEKPDNATKRQIDSVSNTFFLRSATTDTVFRYNYTAFIDSVYARYADTLFAANTIQVGDLTTRFQLGGYRVELRFSELGFCRTDTVSVNKVASVLIGRN